MSVIRPALHHVTLRTRDLGKMVEWYGRVVGARVLFRNEVAAWTSNDEANHRIAFLAVPGIEADPDKVKHGGLHHMAFEYESFADLMASYARLADEGVRPAFALDHGMTVSIYYEDPESNYVELQSDCFGDWERSGAWMSQSPEFADNPIGVFFDAAKVLAAHRAGASDADLHRDIRAGKYLPETIPNIGLPG
jgi:catechol-2,3-dioxygenase